MHFFVRPKEKKKRKKTPTEVYDKIKKTRVFSNAHTCVMHQGFTRAKLARRRRGHCEAEKEAGADSGLFLVLSHPLWRWFQDRAIEVDGEKKGGGKLASSFF